MSNKTKKQALFVGVFTGLTTFIAIKFIPDTSYNSLIIAAFAFLGTYIGSLIAVKGIK